MNELYKEGNVLTDGHIIVMVTYVANDKDAEFSGVVLAGLHNWQGDIAGHTDGFDKRDGWVLSSLEDAARKSINMEPMGN